VARGARAERLAVEHDVSLGLELEAVTQAGERRARVRVEVLLAGLARGVAIARVLVGEDVHLHAGGTAW